MAPREKTELLFRRGPGEQLDHLVIGLFVQRGIDWVTLENGESNLLQRRAELFCESALVRRPPAEKTAQIAGLDPELVIELLVRSGFGELVVLALLRSE